MRLFLFLILALGQLCAQPARTAAPPATAPPKLVVALCIDQFRYDYLVRFRDQYNGGLARLIKDGAVFTNAYYEHFPTVTAIGHSTFLTGAIPSISGIIGNEWYDRKTGRQVTSVLDTTVTMLGGAGRAGSGAASPRRMLVSTVGDELKMARPESKVVGVSVKDRSAILPAGHMANGAYWFDPGSGNFVSSTFYFKELPAWVQEFNRSRFVDKFLNQEWGPSGGAPFRTMGSKADAAYYASLEATPFGNDVVLKFAEAAVTAEGLGKRGVTDVLTVSLSSNDYVGHAKGPDSPEVKDISIRTDRLLADFFRFLDAQVGMRNVLVVMTADHGVAPLPEVSQSRNMPGGRIPDMIAQMEAALHAKFGGGKWIVGRTGVSPYLNHDLIAEKNLKPAEVADALVEAVREMPHVFRAYSRYRLANGQVPGDPLDRRVLNGFFYQRASDITVICEPYYLFEARGTSHGMPFGYDAHVPIVFMGPGIQPGKYHQRVKVNDIAPTVANLLEVDAPSGSIGRVLTEMFAPRRQALK